MAASQIVYTFIYISMFSLGSHCTRGSTVPNLASSGVFTEARFLIFGFALESGHATQELLDWAKSILIVLAAKESVERQRGIVKDEADVVGGVWVRLEARVGVENWIKRIE